MFGRQLRKNLQVFLAAVAVEEIAVVAVATVPVAAEAATATAAIN